MFSTAFPAEDQLEHQLPSTQEAYDNVQTKLNFESQAANILTKADKTMRACLAKMQEAPGYSTYGGLISPGLFRLACS
jgi:hypothetical protein